MRPETQHCRGRNPLHCVVPPHMLNAIVLNGDDDQRRIALGTLSASQSLSSARLAAAEQARIGTLRTTGLGLFGEMLGAEAPHKTRTISTASNSQRLPGTVVRREGEPATGDAAVDEAYDYMGDTFDFYWDVFARDSIDDNGFPLDGTVHFSRNYDNAYWDGRRMVYGDGDGREFTRFTKSIDVIAHELTHGVTQFESGLIYFGQSGALNESLSDVFGSMVRQYVKDQDADEGDWLIGAELFTNRVTGRALRDMAAPGTAYDDDVLGKDPQPADMDHYVKTLDDSGGVHINSGIPNRAFYLAATEIGGKSWDGAGPIWYETLLSPLLRRVTSFRAFARLTISVAVQIYGATSSEVQAVRKAWQTVKVQV